jgi:hypothetical protein
MQIEFKVKDTFVSHSSWSILNYTEGENLSDILYDEDLTTILRGILEKNYEEEEIEDVVSEIADDYNEVDKYFKFRITGTKLDEESYEFEIDATTVDEWLTVLDDLDRENYSDPQSKVDAYIYFHGSVYYPSAFNSIDLIEDPEEYVLELLKMMLNLNSEQEILFRHYFDLDQYFEDEILSNVEYVHTTAGCFLKN